MIVHHLVWRERLSHVLDYKKGFKHIFGEVSNVLSTEKSHVKAVEAEEVLGLRVVKFGCRVGDPLPHV